VRVAERSRWSRAAPIVRAVVALLAIALLVLALWRSWPDVRSALVAIGWAPAFGALLLAALATLLSALSFRVVMVGLHAGRSARRDVEDFLASQIAKYLPGGFWAVAAQTELSADAGVPRRRSGAAYVLTVTISLAAALALSPLAGTAALTHRAVWVGAVAVLLVVATGLVLPRVLPQRVPAVGARTLIAAALLALATWAAFGTHLWLLVRASGTDHPFSYATAVGTFAFAWALGLVAVVAPAGIGVRELALIGLLTPVLSGGHAAALAVVVLSRCITSVSDAAFGLAALAARRARTVGPAS
jgi:uncharacterized membrane protein YbhN (UPF0104 family)